MASVDDGAGRMYTLFGKRPQIQALEQQRKGQVGSGRAQGGPWSGCVLSFLQQPGDVEALVGLWHSLRLRESLGNLSDTCGIQKSGLGEWAWPVGFKQSTGSLFPGKVKLVSGLHILHNAALERRGIGHLLYPAVSLQAQEACVSHKCPCELTRL